uniref:Cystatin domain-containing protein n=1 Tax=Panagrellus redivivus TaxID=6233 RepID=A0A7E4UXW3_PANRE
MRVQSFIVGSTFIVALLCILPGSNAVMTGGNEDISVNDAEVQAIVKRATSLYNQQSNSVYYHIPVEVVKAQSQVVAGIKYTIEVLFGQSKCAKNQVTSADEANCTEASPDNRKKVTISAWQKPWENFEEITFS